MPLLTISGSGRCLPIRGNAKMKLQGSEVQDQETLQSQIGKIAENRLPLSGLEIFHGRLLIVKQRRLQQYLMETRRESSQKRTPSLVRARGCSQFVASLRLLRAEWPGVSGDGVATQRGLTLNM
jgi:hypothetical protein